MAYSMRELQNGAGFMQRGPSRGMTGMGSLGLAANVREDAARKILEKIQGEIAELVNNGARVLSDLKIKASQAQKLARKSDDPSAAQLAGQIEEEVAAISQHLDDARSSAGTFNEAIVAARSAKYKDKSQYWAIQKANMGLPAQGQSAKSAVQAAVGRISRASGTIEAIFTQIVQSLEELSARQQAQAAREQALTAAEEGRRLKAEQASARQAELEQQRYLAEQQREEAKVAREEAMRQREEDLRLAAIEQQRQREEAEIARQEAAEQRAAAMETAREEAVRMAEERRIALEEERQLRAEERELRKQEREDELRRLMLMQELAAKGVPAQFGPPGADTYTPQVPGYPSFGPPGGFMPPGYPGLPSAPVSSYPGMPPVMPGFAPAPGFPAPQGYAPQGYPQQFAQSAGFPPAAGPAPEGFQWAGFDPSSELFGIGGLEPANNPNLAGAQIEEGYAITGPDSNGRYALLYLPAGRVVGYPTEEQLTRPLRDPGGMNPNKIVYVPGSGVGSGGVTGSEVLSTIGTTAAEAAKAVAQILTAKEQTKQAKYQARAGAAGAFLPQVYTGAEPQPSSGGGGTLLVLGALGIGAVILATVAKKSKKKAE